MSLTDKIKNAAEHTISAIGGFVSGFTGVAGYMSEPVLYNSTVKRHYFEKTLPPIERFSFWLDEVSCFYKYPKSHYTAKKLGIAAGALGTIIAGMDVLYSAAHLEEKGLYVLGTLAATNTASWLYEGIREKMRDKKK